MKISELIKELEAIKDANGDIEVKHYDTAWEDYYRIRQIRVQKFSTKSGKPPEVEVM